LQINREQRLSQCLRADQLRGPIGKPVNSCSEAVFERTDRPFFAPGNGDPVSPEAHRRLRLSNGLPPAEDS
jgi:hypothetical protein